tara:strand:+ start:269 stop:433 length:165 start_codon:yes stop_codon:yes gene_type:complete
MHTIHAFLAKLKVLWVLIARDSTPYHVEVSTQTAYCSTNRAAARQTNNDKKQTT